MCASQKSVPFQQSRLNTNTGTLIIYYILDRIITESFYWIFPTTAPTRQNDRPFPSPHYQQRWNMTGTRSDPENLGYLYGMVERTRVLQPLRVRLFSPSHPIQNRFQTCSPFWKTYTPHRAHRASQYSLSVSRKVPSPFSLAVQESIPLPFREQDCFVQIANITNGSNT